MADKELSAITAAGDLDGTETVHVVQSGNSRRSTTADIAQSSFQASTYGLSDVDTNEEIVIDVTGSVILNIFGTVSTSDLPLIDFSTDGGSTWFLEDGGTFLEFVDSVTAGTQGVSSRSNLPITASGTPTVHYFNAKFVSVSLSTNTGVFCDVAAGTNDVTQRSGYLDDQSAYNTIKIALSGAGSFTAIDFTLLTQ